MSGFVEKVDLAAKIAQSAVTNEIAESLDLSPPPPDSGRVITDEERAAVAAKETEAYNTGDGDDTARIKAAFESDTAGEDDDFQSTFEMGAGNDTFVFGDWGKKEITESLTVDMGEGDNDVVKLTHSIEDYVITDAGGCGITLLNKASGVEIKFLNAESFVFENRVTENGVKLDFDDTEFSIDQMKQIAQGDAPEGLAEFFAAVTVGLFLGVGPGEDGEYVSLDIGTEIVV